MKRIKNGFTLLELLVVIGIIGILVALATVSYSSAQKSGRDAKRKQDMVAIQNALEQYYSDNNYSYPTAATGGCGAALSYMRSAWPTDPIGTTPYTQSCYGTSYCVCADLEKDTSGNSGLGCDFSAKTHYCVKALQ
jgi:prepilin-type N-terminal cleavage/methylation domain-containing protein